MIRYRDDVAPDGHTGVEKDGTVEIRRGVKDLDLGESHYAQVRILVDNDKYIKGMAFYSDDLPDGVDVVFNTNKTPDQAGNVCQLDGGKVESDKCGGTASAFDSYNWRGLSWAEELICMICCATSCLSAKNRTLRMYIFNPRII